LRSRRSPHRRINLTWQDGPALAPSYRIQRSTDGGQTFATLQHSALAIADHQRHDRFDDTQLEEGKRYWYRVRAVDGSGNGRDTAYRAKEGGDNNGGSAGLPSTVSPPDQFNLSWIDDSAPRPQTISVPPTMALHFTPLADLGAGVASYPVTSLFPDVPYMFQLTSDYSYDIDGGSVSGTSTATTGYSWSYGHTATTQSLTVQQSGDSSWAETRQLTLARRTELPPMARLQEDSESAPR